MQLRPGGEGRRLLWLIGAGVFEDGLASLTWVDAVPVTTASHRTELNSTEPKEREAILSTGEDRPVHASEMVAHELRPARSQVSEQSGSLSWVEGK